MLMRNLSIGCALMVPLLASVSEPLTAQPKGACQAPELVAAYQEYNQLVCRGLALFEEGRYNAAAATFERALSMRLSEVPNFQLFARYAWALWRSGRHAEAEANLENARIALHVVVGVYHCRPEKQGFVLVDRNRVPVDNPLAVGIASRMCGAAFEYYYRREELETIVADAKLVKVYLAAREEIRPSPRRSTRRAP